MPVNLTCFTCHRTFSVPPSRATTARYCSNDCRPRTYRQIRPDGYVWVWAPDHPNAYRSGRIAEHRLVASGIIGRPLRPTEDVHHRNGDPADNRPENLEIVEHGAHSRLHRETHQWAKCYERCQACQTTSVPHVANGYCQRCYDRKRRPAHRIKLFSWSIYYPACTMCGTDHAPHYAKGFCRRCYDLQRPDRH